MTNFRLTCLLTSQHGRSGREGRSRRISWKSPTSISDPWSNRRNIGAHEVRPIAVSVNVLRRGERCLLPGAVERRRLRHAL
jgi:hypothetical protein